jgi:hypothetical protein
MPAIVAMLNFPEKPPSFTVACCAARKVHDAGTYMQGSVMRKNQNCYGNLGMEGNVPEGVLAAAFGPISGRARCI